MENLADEKIRLERIMAQEKQALTNEKQDLSDQLLSVAAQLQGMSWSDLGRWNRYHKFFVFRLESQTYLQKEQSLKQQLENDLNAAESEKKVMSSQLQERVDEVSELKRELLRLQAQAQKDKMLIETLTSQQSDQEAEIVKLRSDIDEVVSQQQAWDSEKEELTKLVFGCFVGPSISKGVMISLL
jgi:small-conductance mechanosensitive channel